YIPVQPRHPPSFPTRRSSDLLRHQMERIRRPPNVTAATDLTPHTLRRQLILTRRQRTTNIRTRPTRRTRRRRSLRGALRVLRAEIGRPHVGTPATWPPRKRST